MNQTNKADPKPKPESWGVEHIRGRYLVMAALVTALGGGAIGYVLKDATTPKEFGLRFEGSDQNETKESGVGQSASAIPGTSVELISIESAFENGTAKAPSNAVYLQTRFRLKLKGHGEADYIYPRFCSHSHTIQELPARVLSDQRAITGEAPPIFLNSKNRPNFGGEKDSGHSTNVSLADGLTHEWIAELKAHPFREKACLLLVDGFFMITFAGGTMVSPMVRAVVLVPGYEDQKDSSPTHRKGCIAFVIACHALVADVWRLWSMARANA